MGLLTKSLLPKALQLLKQGANSVVNGGGRPPTNISMVDEKIVLSTGGASITLQGDNITFAANGTITSTSQKETKVIAQEDTITIQGGPFVSINPGSKSEDATKMAKASQRGAPFIGGAG